MIEKKKYTKLLSKDVFQLFSHVCHFKEIQVIWKKEFKQQKHQFKVLLGTLKRLH
jgi:hypothetical protein